MVKGKADLKFIDKPNENGHSDKIEIQAVIGDEIFSHTVKYYPSPAEDSFRDDLDWYFQTYLHQPCEQQKQRATRIIQKIIRVGKQMGEQLLSDDYVLYVILEKLDEYELKNVVVTFESERPDFFKEPWEMLVLPDSNRYLATSCAAFMRNYPRKSSPEQWLGLNAEKPLQILFVAPRPNSYKENHQQINFLNFYYTLLQSENSFKVEILHCPTWKNLKNSLGDAEKSFHILHFEGYGTCQKTEGESCVEQLILENESGGADPRTITDFSKLLSSNQVDIMMLDIHYVEENKSDQSHGNYLETAALCLIKGGVKGIITSYPSAYSFSSARLFHLIYTQIAAGNTLAQAVVETRKTMQLNCQQNSLTAQTKELHDWPSVNHYGMQDFGFFAEEDITPPPMESRTLNEINKNVVGFSGEFLPPSEFFGRDMEMQDIKRAFIDRKITVLYGHSGIGKTHLVHQFAYWFVASKLGKTAFYFDYRKGAFSKEIILQMIGHYFDGEKAVALETQNKLLSEEYLLVFDSFSYVDNNDDIKETLSAEEKRELTEFIQEIGKGKSRLMIVDTSEKTCDLFSNVQAISIKGLLSFERKQLASSILRQTQQEIKEDEPGYDRLLECLDGHPYLMQRILPLMADKSVQSLITELSEIKPSIKDNPILALFEYGWRHIPENWKPVLAVLADIRQFISDSFSIAAEMKDEKHRSPGLQLCDFLSIPKVAEMSKIVDAGTKAGFFIAKPSYKEIYPLTPDYLHQKRDSYRWSKETLERIKLTLSKIFCLELKVLDPYLAQQSSSILYRLVVEHNKRWFDSLDQLWQHKEYEIFLEGKTNLSNIFVRAGLKVLIDDWSYRLIRSFDISKMETPLSPDLAIAWLRTANDALSVEEAPKSESIVNGVDFWINWVQSPHNDNITIFKSALMFLETCYRKNNDWEARRNLSLISLAYSEQNEDHQSMIPSLQSLARCEEALGNINRCKILEDRLLNEIPYENLETGIKIKVIIDIIQSRINRKEFDEAQILLDNINTMSGNDQLPVVAKTLKGDMRLKQGRLEEATEIFSELWLGIMQKKHMVHPEMILKNLIDLESKLGKDRFSDIYKVIAPDLPLPSKMAQKN